MSAQMDAVDGAMAAVTLAAADPLAAETDKHLAADLYYPASDTSPLLPAGEFAELVQTTLQHAFDAYHHARLPTAPVFSAKLPLQAQPLFYVKNTYTSTVQRCGAAPGFTKRGAAMHMAHNMFYSLIAGYPPASSLVVTYTRELRPDGMITVDCMVREAVPSAVATECK